MKYGIIDTGVVVAVMVGNYTPDAPWQVVPDNVEAGWLFDGTNYTAPPDPGPQYRTNLTAMEWVNTWTDNEWNTLKRAANGDIPAVPAGVVKRLDKLFDAIKLTGSFDVASATANTFYDYLEAQNFIDAARKAELQQGVLV